MNTARFISLWVVLLHGSVFAAENFHDAVKRATVEYGERLEAANQELNQARARLEAAQAPLLEAMRQAEERLLAAEAEVVRLQTAGERANERFRQLRQESDALQKNVNFIDAAALEAINAFLDGAPAAERQLQGAQARTLRDDFDATRPRPADARLLEIAGFLADEVDAALGGRIVPGSALVDGSNEMVEGKFAAAGPEWFFLAADGKTAGAVRLVEGTHFLAVHPLPEWAAPAASAFFSGEMGTMLADASSGKALRLKETTGTIWQHIEKGGVISYVIVAVGVLALVLIVMKARDVAKLRVDSPQAVRAALLAASRGATDDLEKAITRLHSVTREVFTTALRHVRAPLETVEGHVNAVLLRHRVHAERRLPLIAVIATAAPLLGLLGTVTGMVRTFALITVFGTGDAGKLASGISEVLVATELGLAVAIPALIAHGVLAHAVQRKLALLERHALEFVTVTRGNESLAAPEGALAV